MQIETPYSNTLECTPGWWSDQPQNNCPKGNILAEAREALKNAFLFSG